MMLRKIIATAAAALGLAFATAPAAEAGGSHHTVVFGYVQSFGYGYHSTSFGYGFPCYKGFGYERGYTKGCPGVKHTIDTTPTYPYYYNSYFYPRAYYSSGYWPTRFRGPIYLGKRNCKKPFPYPVSYHSYSDF
jgi:hypothetical protein